MSENQTTMIWIYLSHSYPTVISDTRVGIVETPIRELCAKKIYFNESNASGWCAFHPHLVSYTDWQNFRRRLIALRTFRNALRAQILSGWKGWREENASSWPPLQPPVASGLLDTPRAFIENSNRSLHIQISLWNVFCKYESLTLWAVQLETNDCARVKSFRNG